MSTPAHTPTRLQRPPEGRPPRRRLWAVPLAAAAVVVLRRLFRRLEG